MLILELNLDLLSLFWSITANESDNRQESLQQEQEADTWRYLSAEVQNKEQNESGEGILSQSSPQSHPLSCILTKLDLCSVYKSTYLSDYSGIYNFFCSSFSFISMLQHFVCPYSFFWALYLPSGCLSVMCLTTIFAILKVQFFLLVSMLLFWSICLGLHIPYPVEFPFKLQ